MLSQLLSLFYFLVVGVLGVFFAIPLATVVKAVLTAWPRLGDNSSAIFADINAKDPSKF